MAHDVFISYSSIDRTAAFAACATFEQRGIRCWIAPRDVAAGAEWAEAIIDAIEAAKIMVLIFSANSNESRQVKREIELAVSRGLVIMPLRLEQIAPTKSMAYYMAGLHWIDALTPPLEAHLVKMVGWIEPHLKVNARAEPEAPPRPKPDPRKSAHSAPPRPEPPRAAPPPKQPADAAKPKRKSSSIFGDLLFEFFGVGAKEGGIRINEAARAIGAARALADAGKTDDAIAAYRALIERIEAADTPSLDINLATAQLNLGVTLKGAGRLTEALEAYRTQLRACGDIADEMVEKLVAMGINNQASLLIEMKRAGEALPLYDDLIRRFEHSHNTELNTQVAMARYGRGVAFGVLGRNAEAVAAYDETIARINLRVYPALEDYVALALGNKGTRLKAMGRTDEALVTYQELVTRFGAAKDMKMREQVMKAEVNRASLLIDLKRYDEGLAAAGRVVAGATGSTGLTELRALAMRNQVVGLKGTGRTGEAAAAADRMLAEFGSSAGATIAEQVAAVRRVRTTL